MGIPTIKIRRSNDRLIFVERIPILPRSLIVCHCVYDLRWPTGYGPQYLNAHLGHLHGDHTVDPTEYTQYFVMLSFGEFMLIVHSAFARYIYYHVWLSRVNEFVLKWHWSQPNQSITKHELCAYLRDILWIIHSERDQGNSNQWIACCLTVPSHHLIQLWLIII